MENKFLVMEKKSFPQLKVIFYPFPKQIWAFKPRTKIFVRAKKYFVQDIFDFVWDKNNFVWAEWWGISPFLWSQAAAVKHYLIQIQKKKVVLVVIFLYLLASAMYSV